MTEKKKSKLYRLEEKIDELTEKKWAKNLRITSSVMWNLFLLAIVFGITLTVFTASVGAGYFASLVAKEPLRSGEEMRNNIFSYEETSEIYLADDVYLGKVNSDIERKETTLDNVSPYVIDAVLATEDEYFETHPGVVPKAIFRGVFQDVTNSDSQTGGSTLTQQLIKIQILTNEVSYERKAKEILLAMRLEHFMEKEEILEAYLNIIPYGRNVIGQNIAGVETAAEGIFNVKAKDLTLPQAAYIAGIPQAPFAYTPFYSENRGLKEPEYLKPGIDRMKTVLYRMKETDYITESEYNEAIAYDITKDFREPMLRANERYPYLTQEIQNQTVEILAKVFAEKDGIDPERLDEEDKLKEKYSITARRSMTIDGYKIRSTIKKDLYDKLNDVANNFEHYGHTYTREEKNSDTGETTLLEDPVQVGSVMIENQTGKILAFVGGRDYEISSVNHATQAFRQNGSSMKPLLVYGPAIEAGKIGAGSPVVDVKFKVGSWSPGNFLAHQELGIIPAREALASSQNLATVRLYRDIIDQRPVEYLKKMGFSRLAEVDYTNLSMALGSLDKGTSVKENTNAFATFANGGQFIEGYMVDKIEDMQGNVIYEHKVEPVEVFSPQTSYIMSDMLRDTQTHARGTARIMKQNLNFNIDLAAKTGTTNNYSDVWLVGYNPNISLGVWLGYKEQKQGLYEIRNSTLPPSTRTNLLFARLMNAANEVIPDIVSASDRFERPKGVVSRSFCGISGLAPSSACAAAGLVRSDLFNANAFLPNKADDSIISGSYVSVNGAKYLALPSTPGEFIVQGGTGVNSAFMKRMLGPLGGDASKLFPANSTFSSNVVSGAVFNADSIPPAPVQVAISGSTLTWTASASNDVIGYYIYNNGARVGVVRDGQPRSFTIGSGSYSVQAVDITGKLSGSSNQIDKEPEVIEEPEPEPEPEIESPEPETPPSKDPNKKPKPPTNEGSNGDNSGSNNGSNNGNEEGSNSGNGNSNGNNNGNGNGGNTPPPENDNSDEDKNN